MSNTIYKIIINVKSTEKNNKYNYVYQITEISTGKKYIGSRGSKIEPIKDIKKYRSSSRDKQFKLNQTLNPLNYYYEILSYHQTRSDALAEESVLHERYNVGSNIKYFNKSNQTINGFTTQGRVTVKDNNGNTMSVSIDDERLESGELTVYTKGRFMAKDDIGNTLCITVDDERYKKMVK